MGLFSGRGKKSGKATADDCFAKGQWAQALAGYEELSAQQPEDVKLLRRIADLRARLGRTAAAGEAYRQVADRYAAAGFLVQAIAIHKILLRLDPEAEDLVAKLADLYAKRGFSDTPRLPVGERATEAAPLPEIPLFSALEAEAFQQVIAKLVPVELETGGVLFREGDPGESIFIVTSGAVRVSRGELFLAELGEGTFFGEGAFFSHEPRGADVVASEPSELLEIRREDMEDLVLRHSEVADALAEFYRQRVLDGVLAATPLFRNLDARERKHVAGRFELVAVTEGTEVVREGERDRSLYLIKQGAFAVMTTPPGGAAPCELARLGPGSFFGEVAVVGDTPRSATVRALEAGEVLRISGEHLDPLLSEHPELRHLLEQTRNERAAATVAKLLGRRS
ncbi:MAG: cyclic nucleotide-binding domain-containing protein [Deferrisomatales bacterium]|nr:cyclic nucleotide-binding domain-containing protein [Deferrisomatales bacterium]